MTFVGKLPHLHDEAVIIVLKLFSIQNRDFLPFITVSSSIRA